MKKNPQAKVRFLLSSVDPKEFPLFPDPSGNPMPEIAVAGRSNVGKSSLLNTLFQSTKLVKKSSTPGKTQSINFFSYDHRWIFADLPGYGYAKVPLSVRKKWAPLINTYLEKRSSLQVILLLFDIRRIPNEDDHALLDWILFHKKNLILVLTKVDKLNQKEKAANTKKILESFQQKEVKYIHFSATKNVGRKQLMGMIADSIASDCTPGA